MDHLRPMPDLKNSLYVNRHWFSAHVFKFQLALVVLIGTPSFSSKLGAHFPGPWCEIVPLPFSSGKIRTQASDDGGTRSFAVATNPSNIQSLCCKLQWPLCPNVDALCQSRSLLSHSSWLKTILVLVDWWIGTSSTKVDKWASQGHHKITNLSFFWISSTECSSYHIAMQN